ncbi:MAG TPA: 50S ribosomal protein L24 [Clostridia bacterium]
MLHIKKGDKVKILSGDEKGKTGKVLEIRPKDGSAIVEGINIVSRHKKPRSAQEAGGITKSEAPINLSKLQVICPECGAAARVGFVIKDDKKSRVCKKCGKAIDNKEVKKEKEKTKSKAKKEQDVATEASKTTDAVETVKEKPAAKKTASAKKTAAKTTEAEQAPAKTAKKVAPKKEKTESETEKA